MGEGRSGGSKTTGKNKPRYSEDDYESLQAIEKEGKARREDTPTRLALSEIIVASKVFQWRGEDLVGSAAHIRVLTNALGPKGAKERKPFDAITVVAIGKAFYLVDGHHRLRAYEAAGWTGKIPVEVFKGDLEAARDEAIRRNIQDKMPMTQEAKLEAAWVRLREGLSWNGVVALTKVARRTVAHMASARKDLEIKEPGSSLTMTWRQAKGHRWVGTGGDFDYDEAAEKRAVALAEKLAKVGNFTKEPSVTARAIELASATLPEALMHQWYETALEAVVQYLRLSGKDDIADQVHMAVQSNIFEDIHHQEDGDSDPFHL